MSWQERHDELYGDEDPSGGEPQGVPEERLETAKELLQEAERRNIWIYIADEGRAALTFQDTRPDSVVSKKFLRKLGQYNEAITELVSDRRKDGELTHQLVVLLEDLTDYIENGQRKVELKRGTYRVLPRDLAQHLAELGYAARHPGPEE